MSRLAIYFFGILAVTQNVFAGWGEVTATINTIRSHDINVSTDWISLDNVSTAGNCSTKYDGRVVFYFRDDERGKRQVAMAVAAKMAGKSVRLSWDDTNPSIYSGGACMVRYIDII